MQKFLSGLWPELVTLRKFKRIWKSRRWHRPKPSLLLYPGSATQSGARPQSLLLKNLQLRSPHPKRANAVGQKREIPAGENPKIFPPGTYGQIQKSQKFSAIQKLKSNESQKVLKRRRKFTWKFQKFWYSKTILAEKFLVAI